ncbi:MAG: glutaminyl-peptide cyclotransferase [Planctomycetota bacterium]
MRSSFGRASLGALALALAPACADGGPEPVARGDGAPGATPPAARPPEVPVLGYEVLQRFPHDKRAYTQGLVMVDGQLYESTGRRRESTVRLVDVETGEVKKTRRLDERLFGEGLASVGGLLYQLTWTSGRALIYDRSSLRPLSYGYTYDGEGWGLTTTPEGQLVMSDGSHRLRFVNPKGFEVERVVEVTAAGRRVRELNELEWIDGEIWANVWKSDRIARIDPETGEVRAWVDLSGILGSYRVESPIEDVLNGIAYDAEQQKIYVTGKHWPYLFHIRVE